MNGKKDYHINSKHQKAEWTILISDKVEISRQQMYQIKRDTSKKCHRMSKNVIEKSIHKKEDRTI